MSTREQRAAAVRKFLGSHPRTTRWVRRIVLALAGLYAFYVVAANGLLASHWIEKKINAGTTDVEIHWGKAWTLWPGRVHVNDFMLRINDTSVQAFLTVEHGSTGIEMLPLARLKVRLHEPRAEGARYWMRHRVSAITDENRAQVAAFPPIPGAEPPIIDPVAAAKEPPAQDTLWQVDIEDGEAFGSEIWVQEFRYQGAFHGGGGFYLWPLGEFTLRPTRGTLLPGVLTVGAHEVSKDLSIEMQMELQRFEVPKVQGLDPLRGLDAHVLVELAMADGKFLELYRPLGVPDVTFRAGTLRADLDFHDKHFTDKTDVSFTLENAKLREEAVVVEGPLQLTVHGKPKGHLDVGVDTLGLAVHFPSLPSTAKSPWRIERTSVRGDAFVELDAKPAFAFASARSTFVIPSLEWLTQASSGSLHASGKITSHVQASRDAKGVLSGSLDTTIDETQVTAKTLAAAFAGSLKTTFASSAKAETTTFQNVVLDLPIFTLRGAASSKTTWLKSKLKTATLKTQPAVSFRGEGDLEAGDSAVFAVPVESTGGVAAFAAKWLRGGAANLRGAFLVGDGGYDVSLERGRIGDVELTGFLKKVGSGPFGAFAVSTAGLSAGIRIDAGGVSVSPLAGERWVQEQRTKAH